MTRVLIKKQLLASTDVFVGKKKEATIPIFMFNFGVVGFFSSLLSVFKKNTVAICGVDYAWDYFFDFSGFTVKLRIGELIAGEVCVNRDSLSEGSILIMVKNKAFSATIENAKALQFLIDRAGGKKVVIPFVSNKEKAFLRFVESFVWEVNYPGSKEDSVLFAVLASFVIARMG